MGIIGDVRRVGLLMKMPQAEESKPGKAKSLLSFLSRLF
jgi:hypothetical protein